MQRSEIATKRNVRWKKYCVVKYIARFHKNAFIVASEADGEEVSIELLTGSIIFPPRLWVSQCACGYADILRNYERCCLGVVRLLRSVRLSVAVAILGIYLPVCLHEMGTVFTAGSRLIVEVEDPTIANWIALIAFCYRLPSYALPQLTVSLLRLDCSTFSHTLSGIELDLSAFNQLA